MPEQKYMLHSAEDCFGKGSNHNSIRGGMVGPMGSMAEDLKQYKKSKNEWKKYLKALKKQKKCFT